MSCRAFYVLAAFCAFWGSALAAKVSICIPVYNAEPWLPAALDSACTQTLKDIEIICVDDGSTDGSLAILKSYAARDPRIAIFENDCNRGTHYSRLRAIRASQGDHILWLDADDELFPTIAELAFEKAKSSQADVVLFRTQYARRIGSQRTVPKVLPEGGSGAYFLELAAEGAVSWNLWDKLWRGSMLREIAEEFWLFAQSHHLSKTEDLLLFWFAMRRCGSFAALPQLGYRYVASRGQAARRWGDPAFWRRYVQDVCAVHAKIFAEAEEGKVLPLARKMTKRNEGTVLRLILKLPQDESLILFANYLDAHPQIFQKEILTVMAKLSGGFCREFMKNYGK